MPSVVTPTGVVFKNPAGTPPNQASFKSETPSGAVPGTVFTVVNLPAFVTVNGVVQSPVTDYTLSNLQITFLSDTIQTTDTLLSWYVI
jgi:hypothetical protein